jgi:LuxR family maltose regulon positive regulatory protein
MVTGREDAADVLRNLEDSNAFLIPLDDQRHWYRFHPLFRDFLSFQLDGESAAILHRRASEWFLAHDLGAQAVKHAFHSGEGGQVLKAVLATAPAAFRSGSVNLLNGWLTNLPEQTVMEHPDLAIYQGFTLILIGKVRDAHPFLEAADALQTADAPDASQGRLLSLKAHWALFQGELNECVQLSKDALEFLSQDDVVFRNLTLNVLGQVLELKGDVAAAAGVYEQAFRTGWRQHDRVGALVVFTNLIFALNELGRRRDALAWCDQLLEELPSGADSGFSIGDVVHLSRSLLLLEANELKRARQGVARALETLKLANISQGVLWALFIQGRIELAERNYEAAEKIAQEGRQLASQFGIESVHGAWLSGLKAESDLKQGAFAEAEAWSRAEAYSPAETPGHWLEYPYFTFVRLLLAQQRWSDASELIERIEHSANESGRSRKLITVYLLQARIDAARDDPPSARDRIRRAIRIAAAEGYRRAFLDEGPDIAPLLLSVRQEAPSFVDELLAELAPKEEPPKQAVALVEALTDRELEVLRLVVRGMSNREVASVLVVSLGTVKKHLNNIFGKMAVKSRVQASIKARELNLIE